MTSQHMDELGNTMRSLEWVWSEDNQAWMHMAVYGMGFTSQIEPVALEALIAAEQLRLIERIEAALPPLFHADATLAKVRQVLEKVKGEM